MKIFDVIGRRYSVVARICLRLTGAIAFAGFTCLAQACGIASAHPLATEAGCEVLAQGGTAFDAAVTVGTVLAVVEPYASGLGGGGFFLLHRASDGREVFIDARETAPRKAQREPYLDEKGQPRAGMISEGVSSAGIPGEPAAFAWIAKHYGSKPLSALLAPAIHLAQSGFASDGRYASAAAFREELFKKFPDSAARFLDQGKAPAPGFVLRQSDLAQTLRALSEGGAEAFYRGDVARRLVQAVRAAGGVWELEDLQRYRVVEREPFRFAYRGARITTAPLPSSGGVVLAQALQILERFAMGALSEVERAHLTAEALRRGFQDRARYMGDPAFVDVPVQRLVAREYADARASGIDRDHASRSDLLDALVNEGQHTTHFSVADKFGNRVAATLSVNSPFGSGFVAGDTGVLLNNHLADFSFSALAGNSRSLSGAAVNGIEPGKRPLSSMSPTFVEDARGVLVLGTPGGGRIISMVLLGILDYVDQPQLDLQRIVALPRFHHAYLPDRIEIEPGSFNQEWQEALRAKGHVVQEGKRKWGNMQLVFIDRVTGLIHAESDPRGKTGVMF